MITGDDLKQPQACKATRGLLTFFPSFWQLRLHIFAEVLYLPRIYICDKVIYGLSNGAIWNDLFLRECNVL